MTKPKELINKITIKTIILFNLIFVVNFISLYWHNEALPFIYLAMLFFYLLLHSDISVNGKINLKKAFCQIFFKGASMFSICWRWLMFILFPAFIALYYFDFVLLLITVLVNGVLSYLILKEEKIA